ncbi:methyltransferase [uncultured Aquimarina sp.]|uniref:methyltransferase n=1 Tax=uncultured Aquimarina sp. TaxID=575652 RepID=UPI00260F0768|nr:methyltransferase [uncultured Aquimarina sp.]
MSILRNIIKRITHPFLKKGMEYYYKKPRSYTYNGITTIVHPDVFPPNLTLSTKILLDFIKPINLKNKTFLELGCGSGIISLYASHKEAIVTASDINKTALEYLKNASKENNLAVHCIYSNFFENLKGFQFDFIVINPPYYPKSPKNTKQRAWFCGNKFEYFESLFKQLPQYLSKKNITYMILSEDCALEKIENIASKNNIEMETIFTTRKSGEKNFIFLITQR